MDYTYAIFGHGRPWPKFGDARQEIVPKYLLFFLTINEGMNLISNH
jgi:hypothetical protein